MSNTTAVWLNKYLRALYETDDPIYKSLVADVDGIPAGTINNPQDYNAGAVANMLEFVRQLSLCLIDQLFLDRASGKYLTLTTHEIIGIVKFEGESNSVFVSRIQDYILGYKVSRAAIIFYTRPFSSPGEPQILDGLDDAAFADVSYSDNNTMFQLGVNPPFTNWWVLPGVTISEQGASYFFVLRLENTASADIVKVVDLVNRWKGDGIGYEIQIVTV